MSISAIMTGSRLAYAVVPIKEEVTRIVTKFERGKGLFDEPRKEPGGFMVYFPRGHVLRLTQKELRRYKLDKKAKLTIDMNQMLDPESAIGRVFMAQNNEDRAASWKEMEKQVIALATAKTGNQLLTKVQLITEREDVE